MPRDPASELAVRKKMRKGTHSCFECRRRKIRCIFSSDNPNVCTECFARGSRCIDQEHADSEVIVDQRKNLRERVARLESLVETLLDERSDQGAAAEVLRSLGSASDRLPPTPHSEDTPATDSSAPVLSLFDNAVLSRAGSLSTSSGVPSKCVFSTSLDSQHVEIAYTGIGTSQAQESTSATRSAAKIKHDRTRKALMEALPSYDKLLESLQQQKQWWASFRRKCPGTVGNATIEEFAARVLQNGKPAEIGTLLLSYGACEDGDSLDRSLALVDRWIITDDEYFGTLEGLECAILQGKCYSDIGQARRSWLVFRRALVFAQLMGLHRNHGSSAAQESIWWSIYSGDRFTSLMLGMPYGIADAHCVMEIGGIEVMSSTDPQAFVIKIAYLAGKVIDRTQNAKEQSYPSALDLDQELENFATNMPAGFWEVPNVKPSEEPMLAAEWQETVLTQMCYHQTRIYLHLPFMLKSATESRYEYSRTASMDGAREMLRLYNLLRAPGRPVYACKAVDFIGFTAAVLLVLGQLGYGRLSSREEVENDWAMIENTQKILKQASSEMGGKVAAQSLRVLEQLARLRTANDMTSTTQDTKIVIPYFGTISVRRAQSFAQNQNQNQNKQASNPSSVVPTPSPLSTSNTGSNNSPAHHNVADLSAGPAHQQISSSYSSMDPFVAYDGLYNMNHGAFHAMPGFGVEQGGGAMMGGGGGGFGGGGFGDAAFGSGWQNAASMDIDQDWTLFDTGNSSMSMPLLQETGGAQGQAQGQGFW